MVTIWCTSWVLPRSAPSICQILLLYSSDPQKSTIPAPHCRCLSVTLSCELLKLYSSFVFRFPLLSVLVRLSLQFTSFCPHSNFSWLLSLSFSRWYLINLVLTFFWWYAVYICLNGFSLIHQLPCVLADPGLVLFLSRSLVLPHFISHMPSSTVPAFSRYLQFLLCSFK